MINPTEDNGIPAEVTAAAPEAAPEATEAAKGAKRGRKPGTKNKTKKTPVERPEVEATQTAVTPEETPTVEAPVVEKETPVVEAAPVDPIAYAIPNFTKDVLRHELKEKELDDQEYMDKRQVLIEHKILDLEIGGITKEAYNQFRNSKAAQTIIPLAKEHQKQFSKEAQLAAKRAETPALTVAEMTRLLNAQADIARIEVLDEYLDLAKRAELHKQINREDGGASKEFYTANKENPEFVKACIAHQNHKRAKDKEKEAGREDHKIAKFLNAHAGIARIDDKDEYKKLKEEVGHVRDNKKGGLTPEFYTKYSKNAKVMDAAIADRKVQLEKAKEEIAKNTKAQTR
jgi:hypothetical protein